MLPDRDNIQYNNQRETQANICSIYSPSLPDSVLYCIVFY